ncbi:MAG TPA: hypothetical protein VN426_06470 [Syntrophomonadaceae bacterium]|nr:hypothetical protein [Syntrophomonadaceae bacterium]
MRKTETQRNFRKVVRMHAKKNQSWAKSPYHSYGKRPRYNDNLRSFIIFAFIILVVYFWRYGF